MKVENISVKEPTLSQIEGKNLKAMREEIKESVEKAEEKPVSEEREVQGKIGLLV